MRSIFKQSEIKQKYSIGEVLGTGNFAEVRKGVNKDSGEEVAIKIIDVKDAEDEATIRAEIEILGRLHHPNIVRLIEIFEHRSALSKHKKMYIVMELVSGGELFDRIAKKKCFLESEARAITGTILHVLAYMHGQGVAHRDLKPENVLFATPAENSPIKIADFGLAKLYDPGQSDSSMRTLCGSPSYVAPEVIRPSGRQRGYDSQVDLWSTGVILYILLCGFPPFYEEEQDKLFSQITSGQYEFPSPYWDQISNEAKDLVSKLLELNPKKRLTAKQALEHPWMLVDIKALSATQIETVNLQRYIRKKKFKRVKDAIIAIGRMRLAAKRAAATI